MTAHPLVERIDEMMQAEAVVLLDARNAIEEMHDERKQLIERLRKLADWPQEHNPFDLCDLIERNLP